MLRKLFTFAFFTSLAYGFGMMARQLFLGLGDETTGEFELVTIMEGRQFASRAEDFWSGKLTTVMGGVDLDLRDAVLAPGGADLVVFTVMGGVALRVPSTWIVEADGRAIVGGHNTRGTARGVLSGDAPVLRVHARTFFGGLDIAAKPIEA
ncbi:MAG: cell wall-active antibiotics response protein [Acidimicrobiia bacterium]|nr:cell wall-active antibiotics response protein [Acidimicrobiia bacterium]